MTTIKNVQTTLKPKFYVFANKNGTNGMSHPDNGNINVSVSNRIRASILIAKI